MKPEVLAGIQYAALVAALCFIAYVTFGVGGALFVIACLAVVELVWFLSSESEA